MKLTITTIIVLLFALTAFSQRDCEVDSTIVEKGRDVKGIWYMSDFMNPDFIKVSKTGVHNNRFVVNFQDNNKLSIRSGNSFGGRYYSIDSNSVKLDLCIQTLAYVTYKGKKGKMIDAGLFVDSLVSSNKYIGSDDQMEFYRDNKYIMTLNRYEKLIPFPERYGLQKKELEILKFDSVSLDKELVIINDSSQLKSVGINKTIDFENQTLIILKNTSLQENKKLFNILSYKRRERMKNRFDYPYTYAQLHLDKESEKYYLDISKSFFSGTRYHVNQKGEYIGFIIDKITSDKIEIDKQEKI
jgi:hypothetical protein